jgi:hypothetical protein
MRWQHPYSMRVLLVLIPFWHRNPADKLCGMSFAIGNGKKYSIDAGGFPRPT